jgi:hypothetical protein
MRAARPPPRRAHASSCARDAAANLPLDVFDFTKQDKSVPTLTQPGVPRIDPLLDPHCYEGVEVF